MDLSRSRSFRVVVRCLATGLVALAAQIVVAQERYPSLYEFDLVPAPDYRGLAAGRVKLEWAPSPFGVSVTRGGSLEFAPFVEIESLPSEDVFGDSVTFVAWATTPELEPLVKLGEVAVGRNRLTDADRRGRVVVDFDRFLILVSAEKTVAVGERTGPLVLRGMSPAMALMPDNHLMMPSTSADQQDRGAARERHSGAHGAHAGPGHASGEAQGWSHPPHSPDLPMMPGFEALEPSVSPHRPPAASSPVEAMPSSRVRLRDGQTLDLVAAPVRRNVGGRELTLFGFNGQYPGPLIEVDQGTTLTIRFHNRTHLPTAVHWHGLRLDNQFDGVPGLTQDPVAPGETFVYRVKFPDAGLYWYHPHHREDVLQDLGLHGGMDVRPDSAAPWPGVVHREEHLMLDDLLVTEDGLFPWGEEEATHALMGRFGNLMLVNGEPAYELDVRAGEVVRFYLTNVSNTRVFNLSFGEARLKLIAGDLGLYEDSEWVSSAVIAPAERYVVDVRFDEPGVVPLQHRARAVEHTLGRFFDVHEDLGGVTVTADPSFRETSDFDEPFENEAVRREIASVLEKASDADSDVWTRDPDLDLLLTLELSGLPDEVMSRIQLDRVYFHPIEWASTMPMMNWLTTPREARWILRDRASGLENGAIDWRFAVGDLVKVRLRNDRDAIHAMQHPFHIHGQRFLVLSRNGARMDNLVWKDTVLVPVGSEVDILLELSNPGQWMAHCHISEHLEAGMQMIMTVDDPAQ